MANEVDRAVVRILPDFSGFRAEFDAKIKEAMRDAGQSVRIGVKVDTATLRAELRTHLAEASRGLSIRVPVVLDLAAFNAQAALVQARLDRLHAGPIGPSGGGGGGGGGGAGSSAGGAGGASSAGLLLPGIVAGASLVGPVAAVGTAALAGFTAAAATAGLAFKGLKEQWTSGVGQGGQLRETVIGIKGELNSLSQIAANAAGPGLNKMFAGFKAELPTLAPLVKTFSSALGTAANYIGQGLVSALNAAKPLLGDIGGYIVSASKGFADFAKSDTFKQFLDYARTELPKIIDLIKNLGSGLLSVAKGLSPLGDALIQIVSSVSPLLQIFGKLPAVTSLVVGGVLAVVLASKASAAASSVAAQGSLLHTAAMRGEAIAAATLGVSVAEVNVAQTALALSSAREAALAAAVTGTAEEQAAANTALALAYQRAAVAATELTGANARLAGVNAAAGASSSSAVVGVASFGKALGIAAIAIAAVAAASQILAQTFKSGPLGDNQTAAILKSWADGGSLTAAQFDKMGASGKNLHQVLNDAFKEAYGEKIVNIGKGASIFFHMFSDTDTEKSTKFFKSLNSGLATLAATDPEAAKKVWTELTAEANSMGISTDKLKDKMPQAWAAISAAITNSATSATPALKSLNDLMQEALTTAQLFSNGKLTFPKFDFYGPGLAVGQGEEQRKALSDGLTAELGTYQPVLDARQTYRDSITTLGAARVAEANTIHSTSEANASAEHSYQEARQNTIDTEIAGAKAIKDARAAVVQAEQDAAKQIKAARDGVTQAIRDAATAEKAAEQSVIDAQKSALQAQKDLTQARKDAVRQIQDARNALRDMGNSEESARIQLEKDQLAEAARTGSMTPDQILAKYNQLQGRSNKLQLSQDKNSLSDVLQTNQRTKADAGAVVKAGVNQNVGVLSAEQGVLQANKTLSNSENSLRQTRIDNAAAIKKAEVNLRDVTVQSQKAIQTAITNESTAEVTARKNNKTAIYNEQQQYQSYVDTLNNSAQSRKDAHQTTLNDTQAVSDSYDAYLLLCGQLGIVPGQVDDISASVKQAKKDYKLTFSADPKVARKAIQDVKRDIDAMYWESTGMSGPDAQAKALNDFPTSVSTVAPLPTSTGNPVNHSAAGGPIRGVGGPTQDNIPVMASAGEFMQPWHAVQYYGKDFMEAIRNHSLPKFAEGGSVESTDHIPLDKIVNETKLRKTFSEALKGVFGTLGAGGGWANIDSVKKWLIDTAASKPYVWAAVGPDAYDCSGLVGEVWARLTDHPSYKRYFSTQNEEPFFLPGPGKFTVGINPATHTMGRLDGLSFEAQDPKDGIRVGAGTSDINSFQKVMHLKEVLAPSAVPGGGAGLGTGDPGKGGKLTPDQAKSAAKVMMPSGWSFSDLDKLWTQESSWRWDASFGNTGPDSGSAYGIPQALPGSKMATDGSDWRTNAVTQMKWGMEYIRDRYGSSQAAQAHEVGYHWYDKGGVLQPGPSVVMNKTSKPEAVLTNEQWRQIASIATKGGGHTTMQNVENQYINSPTDADLIARMLEFAYRSAGS